MSDERFAQPPDIWWMYNNRQQRMCYWKIDGTWHWRLVNSDGTVAQEGIGPP